MPLPDGVPRGTPGHCMSDAAETALETGMAYAEGIALHYDLPLWYRHAWNVNAAGEAVDTSWREPGRRYIGRVHPIQQVLDQVSERGEWWFMNEPGPVVPEGELGLDCHTARERAWITEHVTRRNARALPSRCDRRSPLGLRVRGTDVRAEAPQVP